MAKCNTLVILQSLFVIVAFGAEDANLACVADMPLPRFSGPARQSDKFGTVEVTIKVHKNGSGAIESLKAPSKMLGDEVRYFLTTKTEFAKTCAGRKVSLRFTFVLSGAATPSPDLGVSFKAPNEFVLISQPTAPILHLVPIPLTLQQKEREVSK